jgi:hypothetical protein
MGNEAVSNCRKKLNVDEFDELAGLERQGEEAGEKGVDFVLDELIGEAGMLHVVDVDTEVFVVSLWGSVVVKCREVGVIWGGNGGVRGVVEGMELGLLGVEGETDVGSCCGETVENLGVEMKMWGSEEEVVGEGVQVRVWESGCGGVNVVEERVNVEDEEERAEWATLTEATMLGIGVVASAVDEGKVERAVVERLDEADDGGWDVICAEGRPQGWVWDWVECFVEVEVGVVGVGISGEMGEDGEDVVGGAVFVSETELIEKVDVVGGEELVEGFRDVWGDDLVNRVEKW